MTPRTDKKNRSKKRLLPQIPGPRVPAETVAKYHDLIRKVGPLGHPRAKNEDVIGALIDAATPQSAAEALNEYNPKLGKALKELDEEGEAQA